MKRQISIVVFSLMLTLGLRAQSSTVALIPAGTFQMGDSFAEGNANELPVHSVYVSAFYIEKFEVSKQLWSDVYQWGLVHGYVFSSSSTGGGYDETNHPAHPIWYDTILWCNARSEMEGFEPCYYADVNHTAVCRSGNFDLSSSCVKWNANGYRLPTEAEWEKAARGGLTGRRFPWGDTINGANANYFQSGDPFELQATPSTPVGYYNGSQSPSGSDMANGYGLYDMAGNALEFCWDWLDNSYYSHPDTNSDPKGPSSSPITYRVLRGGGWRDTTNDLRCAVRRGTSPVNGDHLFGFRCVKSLLTLNDGLVAYYPFDGNANDETESGNNGNVVNANLTSDRFGIPNSAYSFSGGANSSYIVFSKAPALNPLGSFTYSIWLNAAFSPNSGCWSIDRPFDTNPLVSLGFALSPQTVGQFNFLPRYDDRDGPTTGSGIVAGGTVMPNTWQHVAMVRDFGKFFKLYVDGQLVASLADDGRSLTPPIVKLGQHAFNGNGFTGSMDDFRIYNRALSASEVQELHAPQLVVVQTNRTPAKSEIVSPLADLPTPSVLLAYHGGIFTPNLASVDSNQMTVVLTHGWNSDPMAWASTMASLIRSKVPSPGPNILAWDWTVMAKSSGYEPGVAAAQTGDQGQALGQQLLLALGPSYSKPIHFVGHSLGTLVNASAANYLQGSRWASENTSPSPWPALNMHMTLFDEAEAATDQIGFFNSISTLIGWNGNPLSAKPSYYHPLPTQYAWADNYISAFGLLKSNAVNVILTNGFPANAPNFFDLYQQLNSFHAYPMTWYDETIETDASVMGFLWSFERGGWFSQAPAMNSVYVQAFNNSDWDLAQTNWNYATSLLAKRFFKYQVEVNDLGAPIVGDTVTVVGAVTGQPVLGLGVDWLLLLETKVLDAKQPPIPHGVIFPKAGGDTVTNSPAYVWLKVAVPANAVSMSFDYIIQGDWQNDSLAAAFNGTNVLALPGNQIQTNVLFNSGAIGVAPLAGQTNEFFVGIVGGTSTNAQLIIKSLKFSVSAAPTLRANVVDTNLVLSWPMSATGFSLESSTNILNQNSWTTVPDVAVIADLQYVITNKFVVPYRFYRLKQ